MKQAYVVKLLEKQNFSDNIICMADQNNLGGLYWQITKSFGCLHFRTWHVRKLHKDREKSKLNYNSKRLRERPRSTIKAFI